MNKVLKIDDFQQWEITKSDKQQTLTNNTNQFSKQKKSEEIAVIGKVVFITKHFLIDNFKIPENVIRYGLNNDKVKNEKKWKIIKLPTKTYIDYSSISPLILSRYKLPSIEELIALYGDNKKGTDTQDSLNINALINLTLEDVYENHFQRFVSVYLDAGYKIKEATIMARTHALLHQIILFKENGFKLNLLYNFYITFENIVFKAGSVQYFYSRLSEIKSVNEIPKLLINKRKGKTSNRAFITDKHKAILREIYRNPRKQTIIDIFNQATIIFAELGLAYMSISSVKKYLVRKDVQAECGFYRNGEEETRKKILPHLVRGDVLNVGDQWQCDGSRCNIPYMSEGRIRFLVLFVIMDVHSRKIIGYSLAETENSTMIIIAFQMAIESTKYLPFEIISDRTRALLNKEKKQILDEIEFRGCTWRKTSNPQDKGHVERFFKTFNSSILKTKPFFLGDGIKSKDKNGKPNRALLQVYKNQGKFPTKDGLISTIGKSIDEYNNKVFSKKQSPNQKFLNGQTPNIIPLKKEEAIFMFYRAKKSSIRNSMIKLQIEGVEYSYSFKSDQVDLINLYGENTAVLIKYDPKNVETIYVFDRLNETFICSLKKDLVAMPALANQTYEDKKRIADFNGFTNNYFEKIISNRKKDVNIIQDAYKRTPFELVIDSENIKNDTKEATDHHFTSFFESMHLNDEIEKISRRRSLRNKNENPDDLKISGNDLFDS